jgi:6-phosphogluconolactonase (cycloisomerase 2 family)
MLSKCGLTGLSLSPVAMVSLLLIAIDASIGDARPLPSASGSATTNALRQPVVAIRPLAADPPLKFVDSFKHQSFEGITQVFITPDGKTCLSDAGAEVTSWTFVGGKPPVLTGRDELLRVNTCPCDPSTGRLGLNEWFQHKSIARPTCMAVSANGRFLVAVSKRKPEVLRLGIPIPIRVWDFEPPHAQQFPNVAGFTAAALSPDGRFAYFASFELSRAAELSKTGDKPASVRVGCIQIFARPGREQLEPCATFFGENHCLDDVSSLYSAADGQRIFACCSRRDALVVCDREPNTGLLKLRQILSNGADGVRCLAGINNVDVSSDARFVYTVAGYERGHGAVGVFRIQPSGGVSFVQQILNGEPGLERFLGGHSIAVTADGRHVYATATYAGSVACFDRDAATGRLSARGSVDHLQPGRRIFGPMGLAVHPNSRYIYVACELEGSIATFKNH